MQFTNDMLPADILGMTLYDQGKMAFEFRSGPIFTQLLLADEINRSSPKTQSALLEAMEERQVTQDGQSSPLPKPFFVIATQNPLQQAGVYPLPESQLDRFLMQVNIDYPALDDEWKMLIETTGSAEKIAAAVMTAEELLAAQQLVRNVPVGESVVKAILELVRSGRPQTSNIALVTENVSWGPGPRAGQALMLATRARALLDGRISPSIDDVVALAPAVLRHRMNISFAARAEGLTLDQVIVKMCAPFA